MTQRTMPAYLHDFLVLLQKNKRYRSDTLTQRLQANGLNTTEAELVTLCYLCNGYAVEFNQSEGTAFIISITKPLPQ